MVLRNKSRVVAFPTSWEKPGSGIAGPDVIRNIPSSHPGIFRLLQLPIEVRELHWQMSTAKHGILPEDAETTPSILFGRGKDPLTARDPKSPGFSPVLTRPLTDSDRT